MILLKKLKNIILRVLSKIPNKTKKNTIMWIEVPMSFNSYDERNDFLISTINHLEQTIKIKL